MEQMDVLSPQAERIGAINTVALRDGLLYGDNTDYHGFLAMLAQKGIGVSGRRFTVLGTGGASRAVTTAIRDGGGEVTLVSRTPREGERYYRELERWEWGCAWSTVPPLECILIRTPARWGPPSSSGMRILWI